MTGWQCPGCGACYAPFVAACHRCQPRTVGGANTTPWPPLPNPLPTTTCGPASAAGPEPDFPERTPEQVQADERARLDTLGEGSS
jgi:hypothetical protein